MLELTPREIVAELDKYIIGQDAAKKCVAIALRNRYRRRQLSEEMREEILPKNIIMIGPTGVGKTEIAKRMAKIADAPFVKVEATKFTEVGYVGRDVESIIRDLVETSIRLVRSEKMAEVKERGQSAAEMRLLDLLSPLPVRRRVNQNYTSLSTGTGGQDMVLDDEEKKRNEDIRCRRVFLRDKLSKGELDHEFIEMEIEEQNTASLGALGEGMEGMGINVQGILGSMMPKKRKKQKVSIAEARKIITQEETEKLIQMDEVVNEAIDRAEQSGIVFIDEIDKIAGKGSYGPDISRGGVQRDILPIVEGSTVMTKHGPIKTDYILFIAAGAFHISKPSDLIPELQGRFPIRVELECLNVEVLRRILMEPRNSLIRQYKSLLAADGVEIIFTDDGIDALAEIADKVNVNTENIGARRLHTILEKVLDEIAFNAPDGVLSSLSVDRTYVESKLSDIAKNDDLSRFIL